MKRQIINKIFTLLQVVVCFLFVKCEEPLFTPPENRFYATEVNNITATEAVAGGRVVLDGGGYDGGYDHECHYYLSWISEYGVCWNTTGNPTIDDKTVKYSEEVYEFDFDFSFYITGLTENTTYYVRPYVIYDGNVQYAEEKTFTTSYLINGHDWMDLGLPSGTKWATCNVGANQPHKKGNYYAWGETTTKTTYTQANSLTYDQQLGDISGIADYDAARANWRGTWRTPTKAEVKELISRCTWKWTTRNGVKGCRVVGPNGNSIFLPAAGYRTNNVLSNDNSYGGYWSSEPNVTNPKYAYNFYFDANGNGVDWHSRNDGLTVRPVSD